VLVHVAVVTTLFVAVKHVTYGLGVAENVKVVLSVPLDWNVVVKKSGCTAVTGLFMNQKSTL
jgi:hypothetical protein